MAYTPTDWKNRIVDDEGNVLQQGTPLIAENMNKIETELVSLSEKAEDAHAHENKSVLDNLTQSHLDSISNHDLKLTEHEQKIIQLMNSITNLKVNVVQTIAERDSLENRDSIIVHVIDATADSTVKSGWAQYIYQLDDWIKVAENESIDVVLAWVNITGKPSTFPPSPHSHDELHDHDNKLTLDKLTQSHLDEIAKITLLESLSGQSHTHANKSILDLITQSMIDNIHTHPNKSALDTLTQTHLNNSHSHTNKSILDSITQAMLNNIHTHANKAALDKLSYSGSKSSIDLIKLDELENHTHDYNVLTNKPTIPSQTSQLTNNSGFVTSNATRITVSATAPSNPQPNDIWIVI